MNEARLTEEELAEERRMIAVFRNAGLSEYDACMLTGTISAARRNTVLCP